MNTLKDLKPGDDIRPSRLLKIDLLNPDARCCWECRFGNGGKPSKSPFITCSIDGAVTPRLMPGFCPSFYENERGAKRRMRDARKASSVASKARCTKNF